MDSLSLLADAALSPHSTLRSDVPAESPVKGNKGFAASRGQQQHPPESSYISNSADTPSGGEVRALCAENSSDTIPSWDTYDPSGKQRIGIGLETRVSAVMHCDLSCVDHSSFDRSKFKGTPSVQLLCQTRPRKHGDAPPTPLRKSVTHLMIAAAGPDCEGHGR